VFLLEFDEPEPLIKRVAELDALAHGLLLGYSLGALVLRSV
jgi:hypothetical protein